MGAISKTGGPVRGLWRKLGRAVLAGGVAAAMLVSGVGVANAASDGRPGYWWKPASEGGWWSGSHNSLLGVQEYAANGDPVYCMEAGKASSATHTWATATDATSKIAAFMVDQHKSSRDDFTQASVSYAIHEHLDRGESHFKILKSVGLEGADINSVAANAKRLWDEAAANMPASIAASYKYTTGQRKGTFNPGILNSNGQYVSGIKYTVTNTNEVATFDATGKNTYSGTTSGKEEHIAWTAQKSGKAIFRVSYQGLSAKKSSSPGQDLFALADPSTVSGTVQFNVTTQFQPSVTTQTVRTLAAGKPVTDTITSGGTWINGISVKADGYYWSGLTGKPKQVARNSGETPSAYITRLTGLYGPYSATASATFTEANQKKTVTATSNGYEYKNPGDGAYGTWVWVMPKDEQHVKITDATLGTDPLSYVENDYVDEFGQLNETNVNLCKGRVFSQVNSASAAKGRDLADQITISGLPKGFGSFTGDTDFKLAADSTDATVRVWWAGAGDDKTTDPDADKPYKPAGAAEPKEDANHKLIGTYTYDLAALLKEQGDNGSVRIIVGNGDNGTPTKDGKHFSLTADKTGYYTFVFEAGKDGTRVPKFTSAYDDAFETAVVTENPTPVIALDSETNPADVAVGEKFHDVARISGNKKLDKGAYVQFTAYKPVDGKADATVGTILDQKVTLTDEQIKTLASGQQIEVASQEVSTDTLGTVYWQAALHDADGTIIATHQFGVKNESVTVRGNGRIASESQKQGAVGGKMWDIITVSDVASGKDRGNIPAGSSVKVDVYKHQGQNDATAGQLVESKSFLIDTTKLGQRPGSYSFKAEMDGEYPAAGQYNWVATLIDPKGNTIAAGKYGEASERTFVQEYSTDAAKQWLSADDAGYAAKTVKTYDVLTQKYFGYWGEDGQTPQRYEGNTVKGTQAQFSIWQQGKGDESTDVKAADGKAHDLPSIDPDHDAKDDMQRFKSETFTLDAQQAGPYYYGLRVTNTQDAANLKKLTGEDSDGLVYEAPKRVPSETFQVVKVTSTADPVVTTDMKQVKDTLHVEGTLPAGSSYQVEVWSVKDGKTDTKVAEGEKTTLNEDVTDTDIQAVMDNPGKVGDYQFRFKVWAPDNLGGDPTVADEAGPVDDTWKQGDGYKQDVLLYEGESVESERFTVIKITTNTKGTNGVHTVNGENYVDVTNGADVNDHAVIDGTLPDGYRLGFELYKQDKGEDAAKDTLTATIQPTDLKAGVKELDSQTTKITEPGAYYWVTVFSKKDGSEFPDGAKQVRSARRIKAESLRAIRITTTTFKWSAKGGELSDVAHVEGDLPADSTVGFELHDYKTGEKVTETKPMKLSDLDGYKQDADTQDVTGPAVTVPDANDYYFVEWVKLPGDDGDEFHRGNDRVPNESTRAISADTTTFVQQTVGTPVSDHTVFAHIDYKDDIRPDIKAGLKASWEVWKQSDGDVSKDTLITTLAKQGVALEDGQTEADSPAYKFTQTGVFYFRVRITDDEGKLVAYGKPREASETIHVITSKSNTVSAINEGDTLKDKVTILGPVTEGTMISWKVYLQDGQDASKDTLAASWDTPQTGAYVITAADAAKAAKDGQITIESPLGYKTVKAGDTPYFVYSLTSPKRLDDGTIAKPATGADGKPTTAHLATGLTGIGETESGKPTPFYTDRARNPEETSNVVKVTTQTKSEAHVGDKIHDTAIIEGNIPAGYCIEFEYWQQNAGGVSSDKLEHTTQCVTVPAGANKVDGPEYTANETGKHYWRERLRTQDNDKPGHHGTVTVVSYGKPRVPGETVTVTGHLAQTGITAGIVLAGVAALTTAGGAIALSGRRKRRA